MQDAEYLVVHHTGGPITQTAEEIRRYHIDVKGWRDVGYSHLIEMDGALVLGRGLRSYLSSNLPFNGRSISLGIIGNNLEEENRWRPAQIIAAYWYAEAVVRLVPRIKIIGHDEVPEGTATACPGGKLSELLGFA